MALSFDIKKSINVLLFILKSLGGAADPFRLFAIMYAADVKFLCRYGALISGDSYIAMKQGAIPFHIFSIYKQLVEEEPVKSPGLNPRQYLFINEKQQIAAIGNYDSNFLSPEEATCLFEAIRESKNESYENLSLAARSGAWKDAGKNGEISYLSIAKANGAPDEIIEQLISAPAGTAPVFNKNGMP